MNPREKLAQAQAEREELEARREAQAQAAAHEAARRDPLEVAREREAEALAEVRAAERADFLADLDAIEAKADQVKGEIDGYMDLAAMKAEQLHELRAEALARRSEMEAPPSDKSIMDRIANMIRNYRRKI